MERSFFDMTGGENVYKYITTEGKVTGKRAGNSGEKGKNSLTSPADWAMLDRTTIE